MQETPKFYKDQEGEGRLIPMNGKTRSPAEQQEVKEAESLIAELLKSQKVEVEPYLDQKNSLRIKLLGTNTEDVIYEDTIDNYVVFCKKYHIILDSDQIQEFYKMAKKNVEN